MSVRHLAAAVLIVAVPAPHAAEPVTISYRSDLAKLTQLAPYPAVAPVGLPATWQPVSSGLAVGGATGAPLTAKSTSPETTPAMSAGPPA